MKYDKDAHKPKIPTPIFKSAIFRSISNYLPGLSGYFDFSNFSKFGRKVDQNPEKKMYTKIQCKRTPATLKIFIFDSFYRKG